MVFLERIGHMGFQPFKDNVEDFFNQNRLKFVL